MTWTKLSDDFGDECAELSDAAFRTHVEGLLWSMRRETGGVLDQRSVRRFAESPHAELAISELVTAGLWAMEGQGYRIVHHMEHQPETDVLRARREADALRQRRRRRKAAKLDQDPDTSRRDTHRDTPRDNTRDPGRVGTGRDGSNDEGGSTSTHTPDGWRCKSCGVKPRDSGFDYCASCAAVPAEVSS